MTPTELLLIEVCQEIGDIVECNGHFTMGLARLLDNGNQIILDMTVAELLSVSRDYAEVFNRVHSR